ncbi:Guanylate cyclase 32E [Mizuhopecten yessoensis]|uniref:guanylate cyclase n=1 Tax=Mizuhopecten yessoensis TaxID=6573 RepID=A0A210Q5V7_MIZYE|nr:Guanylate cyclase 32E [Mizuhopecten yessoensis]
MANNYSSRESTSHLDSMDSFETVRALNTHTLCTDRGPCKDQSMTDTGKRIQLVKMLCLTIIPILGLWGFTFYTLTDTISRKSANEKTKKELQLSVELGNLIHHLQQERDMSVLYLSALGPETKTFLLTDYLETDKAIYALSDWPSNLDNEKRSEFESKDKLQEYLSRHRQLLSKNRYNINNELDFYTNIIDVVIVWLYKSITQGKFAVVWKTLVAYLKLTSGKQDIGIERALGTLFYVQGGFQSHKYFEMYNNRINRFRAFYTTAELYSTRVDRLYSSGVKGVGTNITGIINNFRFEIQHKQMGTMWVPDIQNARYWFDNMTQYLDTLLDIQRDLGYEIIARLDVVIDESTRDLAISASFLAVVLIMCPLVIFATENLTSSIQKYALTLVNKTRELMEEKKKTDSLLYQMVPKPVANKLQKNIHIDAEYFDSVTIMFSDIYGFAKMSTVCTPIAIVDLLNNLYRTIDDLLDDYNVYKVETINDCYMVASANRIQISSSTASALFKTRKFITRKRGSITIKGKGEMKTVWLVGKVGDNTELLDTTGQEEHLSRTPMEAPDDIPGEIFQHYSYRFFSPLPITRPRSKPKKAMVRVFPTSTRELDTEGGDLREQELKTEMTQAPQEEAINIQDERRSEGSTYE